MPQFQYKEQQFQKDAVAAVAGVFRGVDFSPLQARPDFRLTSPANFGIDDGSVARNRYVLNNFHGSVEENLRRIRKRNGITGELALADGEYPVLDTHMETGTGKTFTFINTIFELNKLYGLTHFVVIVPSVAIREGVKKSFATTGDYFERMYQRRIKVNEATSAKAKKGRKAPPSGVSDFIHSDGLTALVMTYHTFNHPDRNINEELEGFFAGDARTPMEAIATKNPVLIVDEPQRTEGAKTQKHIQNFNPLFMLRYSATFKSVKNLVYALDSYDAFEKRLVKGISVFDYTSRAADTAFLGVNKVTPQAAELEAVSAKGKPMTVIIKKVESEKGTGQLFAKTGNAEYKNLRATAINAIDGVVTFSDGKTLKSGEYAGLARGNENIMDELMIRDTVNKHLEKERELFRRGIKCISLFFIDRVRDYRDYESRGGRGRLQALFEKCYAECAEQAARNAPDDYRNYLDRWTAEGTHGGYFSADTGRNKKIDGGAADKNNETARELQREITELILRDKERILSPDNGLRFIFAHSALREGWDNPNVFQICKLRTGYTETNLVQEVGRGLRICVNGNLERQDTDILADEFAPTNLLDVFTLGNGQFIAGLQQDLSGRRCKGRKGYLEITAALLRKIYGIAEVMANRIVVNLNDAGCVDEKGGFLARDGVDAVLKKAGLEPQKLLSQLPQTPTVNDGRKNGGKVREYRAGKSNYRKFKTLWEKLHQNAVYHVEYSRGFCREIIRDINANLSVPPIYVDVLVSGITAQGGKFDINKQRTTQPKELVSDMPTRVFLNRLSEKTKLPRNTIINILSGVSARKFAEIRRNPFAAIDGITAIINSVIYKNIVDNVRYEKLDGLRETKITLTSETFKATRYITLADIKNYEGNNLWEDIAPYDSEVPEREISEKALANEEIVVFAKLPRAVNIPAPMHPKGINPDFAIVVKGKDGKRNYYFVAEAKPTAHIDALGQMAKWRAEFLKKYFKGVHVDVKFAVVDSYAQLLALFRPQTDDAE